MRWISDSPGHLTMSDGVFGCPNWRDGAAGREWVEPRAAANTLPHTAQPRIAKRHPAPNDGCQV